MIGNAYVGKTALIMKFVNKTIQQQYEETVGAAFHTFQTKYEDKQYTVQVWDTAGQEKYRSLGPVYYRNSSAAIVVFDITERQSFLDVDSWIENFRSSTGPKPLIFIVANKADLESTHRIDEVEIQQYAEKNGYQYFITSALTGLNVDFLFQSVSEQVIKLGNQGLTTTTTVSKKLNDEKKDSACC